MDGIRDMQDRLKTIIPIFVSFNYLNKDGFLIKQLSKT